MYWFLYDKNGDIQEANKTSATDWTNLNGYEGALSVPEERTDLVTWKASSAFNTDDTLSIGGYYYTCEVTVAQTQGQPSANLSGATEPVWPTMIGTTVADNDLTWTCAATDPSPMAQDAFVNKNHYQVQTVNGVDQLVKTVTDAQLLTEAKTAKTAELQAGLNVTLTSGFTSKSTGHTYVTTTNGEANMHGELTRFALDSTLTSVQFYTADAGWLAHTLAQLQGAFVDGGRWKDAQYVQFNTLYAKSQSATTVADVEAVKWTPGTY